MLRTVDPIRSGVKESNGADAERGVGGGQTDVCTVHGDILEVQRPIQVLLPAEVL